MQYIAYNNRIVPADDARIAVDDRGFRYGDGVFETISVHDGAPYQFGWHRARLGRGLAAIRIEYDTRGLPILCRELLAKNNVSDGLLRIQISRGSGGRGYLPETGAPTVIIETMPMPDIPKQPVSLWLSGYEKISPKALPVGCKLTQGLNSTLARMEARDHRCFDALQLNHQGELAETSSGNLFWLKGGVLYTPAPACGALEGSTRAAILRLSPYETQEAAAGLSALAEAEAVFITNVAWKLLTVSSLQPQQYNWDSEPAALIFRHLLAQDIQKYAGQKNGS